MDFKHGGQPVTKGSNKQKNKQGKQRENDSLNALRAAAREACSMVGGVYAGNVGITNKKRPYVKFEFRVDGRFITQSVSLAGKPAQVAAKIREIKSRYEPENI